MQTDDISVRVKPAGSTWRTLQSDPQSPVLTADQWGPKEARITVTRDPRVPWADLGSFTPIEIDIAGVTVWTGSIASTPAQDDDQSIGINARGWQYLLDEYPVALLFVHGHLADWKDWRSNLTADLTAYTAGWTVEAGSGAIVISNNTVAAGFPRGGAYLDLGQAGAAKRVSVHWEKNTWAGAGTAYLIASDTLADLNPGGSGATATITSLTAAGTSGTLTASVTGRYVLILCDTSTAQADDRYFRVTAANVFGDTAYESGGASIAKAEDVIKAALAAGAATLAADTSLISTTILNLPNFDTLSYQTPREACDAVNALNNYVLRVGADRRVTFKPRPTGPMFSVGTWSNYRFAAASLTDGDNLYNSAVATGTLTDGTAGHQEATQTIALLDGQGRARRKIVNFSSPVTNAILTAGAAKFLETHDTSALKGTLAAVGAQAFRGTNGEQLHPSLLLLNAGELVRLDDRIDPDTGAVGRNGTIAGVTYTHADRSVELELDSTNLDFESVLARYDLLAGAVPG